MWFERHMMFWGVALVVFVGLIWLLSPILLPFVAGMAIAYVLDPIVHRLERLGMSRLVAALFILGLFLLIFVALLLIIAPMLASQLVSFLDNLPGYTQRIQNLVGDPKHTWLRNILGDKFDGADKSMGDLMDQATGYLTGMLTSVWAKGQALISLFSLIVITPVVAFYLICDWDRMLATVDSWIPLAQRETVRGLAREINATISAYVRGQSGVCLILGSYYAIGLTLTGLSFGLLIGLISGLISFIPYVGSMTGLVLSIGVAVAQFFPNWTPIIIVLGIFLFGQFLEGNVLSPKLVGKSVGLHPVWLMFALLAFGYLFGFVGLLVAVPLAAATGVLVRFALRRYLASPLYTGAEPGWAMPMPPRQLALALDHAESLARDDFLAGPSNQAALALVERWPDWPSRAVALVGPEGAGKSHLAAISARISGARFVAGRVLDEADLPATLATGALVVEDAAAGTTDERALFHLLNLAREEEAFLLLTSCAPPAAWPVQIRDLGSRLRALPVVTLAPPDDALLRAVIVKLCADRQLPVDESFVAYLATRIERSFAAARAAVIALDQEALRQHRPATRALAAEMFGGNAG